MRNWKHQRPQSLTTALRLCKDYGKDKKLSVSRIADLLGTSDDCLYKWLSNGSMPANKLLGFENACRVPLVTQYLAHSHGYLLVPLPNGKRAAGLEIAELNIFANSVLLELAKCYEGKSQPEETREQLMCLVEELIYQREEVNKLHQPNLFEEGPLGMEQYD